MADGNSWLLRYTLALALGLLAMLIALALQNALGTAYYWPFFIAVMVAAWYGGLGPGLIATGVSGAAIDYYFEHPAHRWGITEAQTGVRILGFTVAALVICILNEERRAAYQREEHARRIAETAMRTRDRLLTAVAHDLKNPIGVILLRAQLLQRRLAQEANLDAAALQAGLVSIETTAMRIVAMIDQQLDIARSESERSLSLQTVSLDLVALIRDKIHEWQETTDEHRIVFTTTLPTLRSQWNATCFARILDNLLSNAIKYSPAGGTIALTLTHESSPKGEWATITIRDEGISIPATDLPYIFEPFQRARNVTGTIEGSGIGLTSARALVEQYGGTLTVASRQGEGTTFMIRVPVKR